MWKGKKNYVHKLVEIAYTNKKTQAIFSWKVYLHKGSIPWLIFYLKGKNIKNTMNKNYGSILCTLL